MQAVAVIIVCCWLLVAFDRDYVDQRSAQRWNNKRELAAFEATYGNSTAPRRQAGAAGSMPHEPTFEERRAALLSSEQAWKAERSERAARVAARQVWYSTHSVCVRAQRVSNLLCESNQAKKKAVQRGREAAAKQRTKDRRRR